MHIKIPFIYFSQEFPKFQECLSEHIIDCTLDEMEIYGGYTNVYEHMCTEGMAGMTISSWDFASFISQLIF